MTLDKKDYAKYLPEAKTLVNKVVHQNMADSMLFSAGTDTRIIAYEAVKYKPDIPCLTLAFKHGNPKDTQYVKEMVSFLKLKQETHVFDKDEVATNGRRAPDHEGIPRRERAHDEGRQHMRMRGIEAVVRTIGV